MPRRKGRKGGKQAAAAAADRLSPDLDRHTTYLGVDTTQRELDELNMKHQIHSMILGASGLVDPSRAATDDMIAFPMCHGRRIVPGAAHEEALDAIVSFQPTGKHFETGDGLDDPYVWARRGENGELTIKRQSKVLKSEVTGLAAFWIKTYPDLDKERPKATGRWRPDSDDESGAEEDKEDNETIVVDSDIESAIPGPINENGIILNSATFDKDGATYPKLAATRKSLAAGERTAGNGCGIPARGSATSIRLNRYSSGLQMRQTVRGLPAGQTWPVDPSRPTEVGFAVSREQMPSQSGLPSPQQPVWKDQAWFDSVADADTIAALEARARRARQAALDNVSPLASPDSRVSSIRLTEAAHFSSTVFGLSIAEQKQPAGLALVDAYKARLGQSACPSSDARVEDARAEQPAQNRRASKKTIENSGVEQAADSVPPFEAPQSMRAANPLLDRLAEQSFKDQKAASIDGRLARKREPSGEGSVEERVASTLHKRRKRRAPTTEAGSQTDGSLFTSSSTAGASFGNVRMDESEAILASWTEMEKRHLIDGYLRTGDVSAASRSLNEHIRGGDEATSSHGSARPLRSPAECQAAVEELRRAGWLPDPS